MARFFSVSLGFAVLLAVAFPSGADAQGPDCSQWNTEEFFEAATSEDVNACLAAGARFTRAVLYTPLHRAAGFSDNPLVIEALLAAGADLTAIRNQ